MSLEEMTNIIEDTQSASTQMGKTVNEAQNTNSSTNTANTSNTMNAVTNTSTNTSKTNTSAKSSNTVANTTKQNTTTNAENTVKEENKEKAVELTFQKPVEGEVIKEYAQDKNVDVVVGPEARGFLFGCPVAIELNAGFVPVRKPGKLPREVVSQKYELEYGTDKIEVHQDAFPQGANVLVVDDLLATGGTAEAACKLVKKTGANLIGTAFLIELKDLKGRDKLKDSPKIVSMLQY